MTATLATRNIRENTMTLNRRHVLMGALAAPAVISMSRLGSAAPAQTLKISHQFPGGTIDEGDFRDRLCRKFAAELERSRNSRPCERARST
jgi:hypothetical protein